MRDREKSIELLVWVIDEYHITVAAGGDDE